MLTHEEQLGGSAGRSAGADQLAIKRASRDSVYDLRTPIPCRRFLWSQRTRHWLTNADTPRLGVALGRVVACMVQLKISLRQREFPCWRHGFSSARSLRVVFVEQARGGSSLLVRATLILVIARPRRGDNLPRSRRDRADPNGGVMIHRRVSIFDPAAAIAALPGLAAIARWP